MNKTILKCLAGLAAAGPLLVCSHARAAVESFVTTTPIPSSLTDWTGTLSFPEFNPSLGTLLSVTLDLSGDLQTTLTVMNGSPSASSGRVWTDMQLTVEDGGNNLISPSIDINSHAQTYTLGAGQTLTLPQINASGSSSQLYTLSAILSEFTGSGSIVLDAGTFTSTLLANSGGNTSASQVTSADATGTVIYNYESFTAVPEPSNWVAGLSAAGLAGFTLLRRRKADRLVRS